MRVSMHGNVNFLTSKILLQNTARTGCLFHCSTVAVIVVVLLDELTGSYNDIRHTPRKVPAARGA